MSDLSSLPPGIYYGDQRLILVPHHPIPLVSKRMPLPVIERVLYAWNTLNAAHHGRFTGNPREVSELCVMCRKILDLVGLRYPSQTATGG